MPSITNKNQTSAAKKELKRLFKEVRETFVGDDLLYEHYFPVLYTVRESMLNNHHIYTGTDQLDKLFMLGSVEGKSVKFLSAVVSGLEDWNLQQPDHKVDTGAMMDQIALLPQSERVR